MKESVISRIRARTSPETRHYIRKNLDIAARVNTLLKQKGWTQKDLAKALGKTESEVSRMLSGLHNVTLKSIAKLEIVLGADILVSADQVEPDSGDVRYVTWHIQYNRNSRFQQSTVMPTQTAGEIFMPIQTEEKYAGVA